MTVSTNALVFYGCDLQSIDFDDESTSDALTKIHDNAKHEDEDEYKVIVRQHCCDSEPFFYIAIQESTSSASRGEVTDITQFVKRDDDTIADWNGRLEAWCKKHIPNHVIDFNTEIGWKIAVWADM